MIVPEGGANYDDQDCLSGKLTVKLRLLGFRARHINGMFEAKEDFSLEETPWSGKELGVRRHREIAVQQIHGELEREWQEMGMEGD